MKGASYCIFNQQYSADEYERIVPLLIDHMRQHGEWGEFFPLSIAPFAYNASAAMDYFPLDRSQAVSMGATWYADEGEIIGNIPQAPDTVENISTPSTFLCSVSGRPFKIVEQELDFYRVEHLPPPHECFAERTKRRFLESDPHRLWHRSCAHCSKDIMTTYAPERPEIVYCEECYLKEVY